MSETDGVSDHGLEPATIASLNHDFYSLRPWVYLRYRLRNLILSAGRGGELQDLLAKGVKIDDFEVGDKNYSEREGLSKSEKEDQLAFTVTETEVLLHQCAETLLRLYLAHEGEPECPWLELANERSFANFKRRASQLSDELSTPRRQEAMSAVLLGRSNPGEVEEERWGELASNSAEWLAWLGRYFLEGDVYNAAKHGLGVWPQNVALKVTIDEELDFIDGSGPCLEYLHTDRGEDGTKRWHRTTKWIRLDRSFGAIHVACKLIERLWAVGAVHHGYREQRELELITFPSPTEMLGKDEMTLAKVTKTLL